MLPNEMRSFAGQVSGCQSLERLKAFAQWKKTCSTLHADREQRRLAARFESGEQRGLGGQLGRPVHAQRLLGAGHQEHERDATRGQDVLEALDQLVALALGDQQRVLVFDRDEARAVALGRHVRVSVAIDRREQQQRRMSDEGAAGFLEGGEELRFDRRDLGADDRADLLEVGEEVGVALHGASISASRLLRRARGSVAAGGRPACRSMPT